MTSEELITSIHQRHVAALALVNCDTGPARMALWLALTELADRLDEAPIVLQPATVPPANGAATHAEPDAGRAPAALSLATLDDESLQIVHELDAGSRTWRSVEPTDRRVITLAAIREMCDISPEQLGILRFDEWRPQWMPKFNTLTAQLGMTWNQMRAAAQEPF